MTFHIKNLLLAIALFLFFATTSCTSSIRTKNGAFVNLAPYYMGRGEEIVWEGGVDDQNRAHGEGVLTLARNGHHDLHKEKLTANHGKFENSSAIDQKVGGPSSIVLVDGKRVEPEKAGFFDGLNPEALVKGGLALGGAAVLANQGADSSIINEYGSSVLDGRAYNPTQGSGSTIGSTNSGGPRKGNLIDSEGLRNVGDHGKYYVQHADVMYQQYLKTGKPETYAAHRQTVESLKSIIKR